MTSRHGRHLFSPPLVSGRVILRPWLSSSLTLVDTMAALCSPSKLYSALSLGDNEGLIHPGQAEQRADLLAGVFFLLG